LREAARELIPGSGHPPSRPRTRCQCALDGSDHLEIAADPVALADMLNALDPSAPVHVPCLVVLPVTGPVGPVPNL
jgi:hypothetical protein